MLQNGDLGVKPQVVVTERSNKAYTQIEPRSSILSNTREYGQTRESPDTLGEIETLF